MPGVVCELARKHVTVALSGDGGDENFAGYRRYRWHVYEERVRSLLPQGVRGPLFGFLGAVYPKLDWAPKPLRAKTTFQALARDSLAGFLDSVSVVSEHNRRLLFSKSFQKSLQGYNAVEVFKYHASPTQLDAKHSLGSQFAQTEMQIGAAHARVPVAAVHLGDQLPLRIE